MYYHYSALVNSRLDLLQACALSQIAVASTFRQLSLVRPLLYFYFWFTSFAFSNWPTDISVVWVLHSYLKSGAYPGFSLGEGAPLRNDVTEQYALR